MRDSVDILKSAGAIAESVLAPSAEEIDRLATYPTDGLTLLGEQGFWGLTCWFRLLYHGYASTLMQFRQLL